MTDKEQIIIDGVEVLKEKINMCFILLLNKLETPETIEQTIYEHLDAFVKEWNAQLARKTQECEKYKKRAVCFKDVNKQLGYKYLTIKQECEELKKEIINKNEKIKELRFSVSDLTNRLCHLNAEKSFRIVDLEQTLDGIENALEEIEEIAKDGLNPICYKSNCSRCKCYNGDDCKAGMISLINNYFTENGEFVDESGDFVEALEGLLESERKKCNKAQPIAQRILDIISKAKDGE